MVTILHISTTSSHLKSLNITNPPTCADAQPNPDLGHVQKEVNLIPIPSR
jgi:hypothetical protein